MNQVKKILILTQKVDINDDLLGFMHGWIDEFAMQCEQVIVICLSKGYYSLPENVKVRSLGKEKNYKLNNYPQVFGGQVILNLKLFKQIKYLYNFYLYIWQERKNYDVVFVHMNEIYAVLGGFFWKLWNKKIGLWYAHKSVGYRLKVAEKFSDIIFTASTKSFRHTSKKIKIVGHGIDLEKFKCSWPRDKQNSSLPNGRHDVKNKDDFFKIITIGRISPIKDYETLINAIELLYTEIKNLQVEIIGGPGTDEQKKYFKKLQAMVENKKLQDVILFIGSVPNNHIVNYLRESDLFINTSQTGSLDKAILEAMACGLPILSSNEALIDVIDEFKDKLIFPSKDLSGLIDRIKMIYYLSEEDREKIGVGLMAIVEKNHSLHGLISKILNCYRNFPE
jgi:glycosyltransferase involved in cell wall biosynthesis